MPIKNIIFDLGGVIIDINYNKTITAFRELGALNFEDLFSQSKQDSLFDNYDTGTISSSEFRKQLKLKLNLKISDYEFDSAWNKMLLDLPGVRLQFIKNLRNRYRVFLFSNTNDIHLKEVFNICYQQNGYRTFDSFFEKEYYSNKIGYKKPEPSSFIRILSENSLTPEETIFIDDSTQNIIGAQSAGIHGIFLSSEYTIFNTLEFIKLIEKSKKTYEI